MLVALYSPVQGSGKSTVASILGREKDFIVLSFATTLKEMAVVFMKSIGMTEADARRHAYGDDVLKSRVLPGLNVTTRQLLRTLGTEWGRKCVADDVWVQITMHSADRLLKAGRSVVIDDMRFVNEYEAVKAAGGKMVKIVRHDVNNEEEHESEGALDSKDFDITIDNSSDMENLHKLTLENF